MSKNSCPYRAPILLLAAISGLVSLSGCTVTQQMSSRRFKRERQERSDYVLSLIYERAPELRGERLALIDSHFGGTPPRGEDIRTAEELEARFRFVRDGDSAYRFVRIKRIWPDPAKAPKFTLTMGRERLSTTHIVEERRYSPKRR